MVDWGSEATQTAAATGGFLYAIVAGHEINRVKVGKASNVYARMALLQTACPVWLGLHSAIWFDDVTAAEREAHVRLQHARTVGEWFDMADYAVDRWLAERESWHKRFVKPLIEQESRGYPRVVRASDIPPPSPEFVAEYNRLLKLGAYRDPDGVVCGYPVGLTREEKARWDREVAAQVGLPADDRARPPRQRQHSRIRL
jgi:hypothetical protein